MGCVPGEQGPPRPRRPHEDMMETVSCHQGRAGFKPSAPTNSAKWGVSHLIYPCSTTVIASKDTDARINLPFPSPIVLIDSNQGENGATPTVLGRFAKAKMAISWSKWGFKPAPTGRSRAILIVMTCAQGSLVSLRGNDGGGVCGGRLRLTLASGVHYDFLRV